MKIKKIKILIGVIMAVLVILSFTVYDIAIKVNSISVSNQSSLISNANNYGKVEIGNVTLTFMGGSSEYLYYVVPLQRQSVINLTVEKAQYGLLLFEIFKTNSSIKFPFTGNGFTLTHLSVSSPQGFSAKVQYTITDWKNYTYVDVNTDNGGVYSALENYPGFHNFFLNFTMNSYAFLGPLKFKGSSSTISVEWNVTVYP